MAIIENLDIVLGARTEKLDAGLDRSTGRVKKFESDVGGIGAAAQAAIAPLGDIGTSILAAIPGANAAVAAFRGISAAFSVTRAAAVTTETRQTARAAADAANSMQRFATASTLAAGRGRAIGSGLRIDRPATAAGVRLPPLVPNVNAAGAASALGALGPIGIAAGAAVAAAFVGVAAAAAGAAVTIRGVRDQMTEIDATADAAKRLGFEFNELVQLRMAIGRSTGMDDSQIDAALSKMQLNLEAARSGSGALAEQLQSLGLDAGQLLQAGPVEAMKQISAAAQQMKSPIDQNRLAFDLAGKSGVALAQSLRDGPAAIDEAATKAQQLGLTLSQAQTEQVGAANDAWEDMQLIATGVFRQIAAEVSPVITAISTSITDVGMSFGGWQSALPTIVDNVVLFAGALFDAYEIATVVQETLRKIIMLDFSGAGEAITSAMDMSTGQNMLAKVQEARDAAAKAAQKPLAGEIDSDALQQERDAQKAVGDAAKAAADQKAADEVRNKKAVTDRIQSMREEIAAIQQGAEAFEQLKLARQLPGATDGQIKELAALEEQKEAIERRKQLLEQLQSPKKEFDTQLSDLNSLFESRQIDFATYSQAARSAAEEFGSVDTAPPPQAPSVGALQQGSVEAYSAGLKNEGAAKQASLAEKSNVLLQNVETQLQQMNAKFGNIITIGKA